MKGKISEICWRGKCNSSQEICRVLTHGTSSLWHHYGIKPKVYCRFSRLFCPSLPFSHYFSSYLGRQMKIVFRKSADRLSSVCESNNFHYSITLTCYMEFMSNTFISNNFHSSYFSHRCLEPHLCHLFLYLFHFTMNQVSRAYVQLFLPLPSNSCRVH